MDSHRKSIVKAFTWRLTGSIDTFLLSWFISGSIKLGATISFFEFFTKIALYYLHERAWNKVK
jgi:uncharacterized membrane protein